MTVFVYVNISEQVGDPEHINVFANADAAENWLEENDPEGVAFEYGFWNEPDWPPDCLRHAVILVLAIVWQVLGSL